AVLWRASPALRDEPVDDAARRVPAERCEEPFATDPLMTAVRVRAARAGAGTVTRAVAVPETKMAGARRPVLRGEAWETEAICAARAAGRACSASKRLVSPDQPLNGSTCEVSATKPGPMQLPGAAGAPAADTPRAATHGGEG